MSVCEILFKSSLRIIQIFCYLSFVVAMSSLALRQVAIPATPYLAKGVPHARNMSAYLYEHRFVTVLILYKTFFFIYIYLFHGSFARKLCLETNFIVKQGSFNSFKFASLIQRKWMIHCLIL